MGERRLRLTRPDPSINVAQNNTRNICIALALVATVGGILALTRRKMSQKQRKGIVAFLRPVELGGSIVMKEPNPHQIPAALIPELVEWLMDDNRKYSCPNWRSNLTIDSAFWRFSEYGEFGPMTDYLQAEYPKTELREDLQVILTAALKAFNEREDAQNEQNVSRETTD